MKKQISGSELDAWIEAKAEERLHEMILRGLIRKKVSQARLKPGKGVKYGCGRGIYKHR